MDCMDFRWIGKLIRQKDHLPLDAKVIDSDLMEMEVTYINTR